MNLILSLVYANLTLRNDFFMFVNLVKMRLLCEKRGMKNEIFAICSHTPFSTFSYINLFKNLD